MEYACDTRFASMAPPKGCGCCAVCLFAVEEGGKGKEKKGRAWAWAGVRWPEADLHTRPSRELAKEQRVAGPVRQTGSG